MQRDELLTKNYQQKNENLMKGKEYVTKGDRMTRVHIFYQS